MTKSALLRPTLLPGLARLWRDRHTLQLGLDPSRAVLVELADPRAVEVLDLLDGSRTERTVVASAAALGVAAADARSLLSALRDAGLVVGAHCLLPGASLPEAVRRRVAAEAAALALRGTDGPASPAQILRRRLVARVVVAGRGRLAAPVAVALATAGVGHVHPKLAGPVRDDDSLGYPFGLGSATAGPDPTPTRDGAAHQAARDPSDMGTTPGTVAGDGDHTRDGAAHQGARGPAGPAGGGSRGAAVAAAIQRAAPGTRTGSFLDTPTLVVQAGLDQPVTLAAAAFARRRQAHLAMEIRDGRAVVGPFVVPGRGPCLNCLDLHRQDRDPGWPAIAAQLGGNRADGTEPCSAPTVLAAASFAAAEVLAYLDGGSPDTIGAAVEITAPGRLRRRTWPPHPRCGCLRGSWRRTAAAQGRSQ